MEQQQTSLPEVQILTPRRFGDARGFFSETWSRKALLDIGIDVDFVQDNHSLSREKGVVRGLHFQAPPHAQDKLVRVSAGAVLDVAVDIRVGSPTYGQWTSVRISAENGRQVFVPKGFLHGFVTLEDNTELLYKCSDTYAPDCDGSVYFADPDLGIDWGIDPKDAILSDKDKTAQSFADFKSPFVYKE
tara:strand:+ start:9985 stop:10548 length:564 start_codon:yes stop_codon:yes gene_type:complete